MPRIAFIFIVFNQKFPIIACLSFFLVNHVGLLNLSEHNLYFLLSSIYLLTEFRPDAPSPKQVKREKRKSSYFAF